MRYPAPATVAMIDGFAEAFAQCRDRDAHGVGERVGVLIPRSFQELFGADDTAFGGDEDLEHGELLAGERDVAAVAVDLAAERIQTQTCDLSHGRPVVGAPAVECSETEHELLEFERLGEVVVGAQREPGRLVVELVGSRGRIEDRQSPAGGDDAFGDLVAGGPRGCRGPGWRCRRRSSSSSPSAVCRLRRRRRRSPPGVGRHEWLRPCRARPRRSAPACSGYCQPAHIVGISKRRIRGGSVGPP